MVGSFLRVVRYAWKMIIPPGEEPRRPRSYCLPNGAGTVMATLSVAPRDENCGRSQVRKGDALVRFDERLRDIVREVIPAKASLVYPWHFNFDSTPVEADAAGQ